MSSFKSAQLRYALDAAAQIKGEIFSDVCHVPFEHAFYMDEDVLDISIKPRKRTLLHDFISYRMIDTFYEALKDSGVDIYPEVYKEFESYDVDFEEYEEYLENNDGNDYHDYLLKVYKLEVNVHLVCATFTILFRDRHVMRKFNHNVSEEIKKMKQIDYPIYLKKDGVMKRWQGSWPVWLKEGLLKREDGHCAICHRDLTGVYALTSKIEIDHIVPLNMGGTNDPTNLQAVCKTCNGKKGGDKLTSSDKYAPFW
ncbi:HNH endonuclease [Pantoea sp.]|uniref:HNH endonuclease n=1 Tax=Pantoea sp. TaxID=69393 RepID=UPI0031E23749